MEYCKQCILPNTRPNLKILKDGICNACHSNDAKEDSIDWRKREKEFSQLIASTKLKAKTWDCVIPVSGGKDSTWQVIKALEYGLKPLCVTWKTPARNSLGQKNLDNLVSLGVDHIDFSINPLVEKKLTLQTLKEKGSVAIPMHLALFSIPLQIAMKFKIPLVLWGENSGVEYGGDKALGSQMTREWLLTYGVTQGTTAEDWVSEELSSKDLSPYTWPTDSELENAGVKAAFLGHYFAWDPEETFKIAKENGFEALTGKPKTGFYTYADVDDEFLISIHHWLKWYKFGFTRLWDNLSLEIRAGRMTREQALAIVQERGDEKPVKEIQKFCLWANISENEFFEIIEKFRNKDIWSLNNGNWTLKAPFPKSCENK